MLKNYGIDNRNQNGRYLLLFTTNFKTGLIIPLYYLFNSEVFKKKKQIENIIK